MSELVAPGEEDRFFQWGLEDFLEGFLPGSRDENWTWSDEYRELIDQRDTKMLIEDIRLNGIREPVLLGDDRRVWDGHHRVVAAIALGYKRIPVTFALRKRGLF